MNNKHLTQASLLDLAVSISRGDTECQVLAERTGRVTVRVELGSESVVVKLWNLSDSRSAIRRITRRTKGRSEYESLHCLHEAGVPVPVPLSFFQLRGHGIQHHEALIVQDLYPCVSLLTDLHACSKGGDSTEVRHLDDKVIRITAAMIDLGVLDNDHRLANFVIRADRSVYRLDFENALSKRCRWRREQRLGMMIGALVSSHAWATRFAPGQTPHFVEQLKLEVPMSIRVLDTARCFAAAEITRLANHSGFKLSSDVGI